MCERDLQALYLSRTYCHKTCTRPPTCVTLRQPTIYPPGFGVCSIQMLVKIYNKREKFFTIQHFLRLSHYCICLYAILWCQKNKVIGLYQIEVCVPKCHFPGTRFFPKNSGKFPVPSIWEHPLSGPNLVPAFGTGFFPACFKSGINGTKQEKS